LGSYKTYQEVKRLAHEHWKKFPPRPVYDDFSVNCTGSYVFQSKNCKKSFDVSGVEDGKHLFMLSLAPMKDCYDVSAWGNNINLAYEAVAVGENISNVRFCDEAGLSLLDAEYSKMLFGGSHMFGCVGLKKGEYCILNKQYTKEEYEILIPKIKKHMNEMPYIDRAGRRYKYGEFFPTEFSPFPYNDTLAQRFFPMPFTEAEKKNYVITKKAEELPDHIKDAPQSILSEVIGCKTCGRGYKLISFEFEFLKRMNLPLPRQCPFCRIKEKLDQWVKESRIVDRVCSQCGAEFETHYPKEDVEYILCKKCYQHEVA
jgi:Zn ribbon nucleic-acid-binding protein